MPKKIRLNLKKEFKLASIDPFHTLAKKLIDNGYTVEDILHSKALYGTPIPYKFRVINYMSDIMRGLK